MHRILCETGLKLSSAYLRTTLDWVSAEANKRVAIAIARDILREDWMTMAQCAENMRAIHDQAFSEYVDHVIGCSICSSKTIH
jgi:hypothetical protein